jgi:hypothetical protein
MGHPVLALLVSAMGICWGKGHILSVEGNTHIFLNNTIEQYLWQVLWKKIINSQIFRKMIQACFLSYYLLDTIRERSWLGQDLPDLAQSLLLVYLHFQC